MQYVGIHIDLAIKKIKKWNKSSIIFDKSVQGIL